MIALRSIACLLVVLLPQVAKAQAGGADEPDIVETIDLHEAPPAAPSAAAAAAADPGGDVTESLGGSSQSDGDVVETMGDSSESASVSSLESTPSAGDEVETSRTKLSGWARDSLELYPYDKGLDRSHGEDVYNVPRDRIVNRTQLLVRARYQKGSFFEATVSGLLGVNIFIEGSGENKPLLQLNSQGTSTLLDAKLMECYLGFYWGKFDLRIGQQRVAWGVADIASPNDIVNSRDLHDPFLAEQETLRIPTPMIRGSYFYETLTLDFLFSPVFVPDRVSLYGRNWSAIQPDSPPSYQGLFGLLGDKTDISIRDERNSALQQTKLPNRGADGLWGGARASLHLEAVDLNAYYQYGYDGTPYLWVDPTFAEVLSRTDFATAGLADFAPVLRSIDQGSYPLFSEYVRRHHVGFDLTAPLGPIILRVDAAYDSRRVFYRRDLTSIANPAFQGVVSAEYQTGDIDKVLLVEAVYLHIFQDYEGKLLIYERDSYGAGSVLRWPLFSVFHIDARLLIGVQPFWYLVQPAIAAHAKSWVIRAGALINGGEEGTFGWYYRHNATAYVQARYNF
jgi:hypothetical protein